MSYVIPAEIMDQRVKELTKLWERLLPLDVPNDTVFLAWFSSHSFLTIAFALSEASKKFYRLQGHMSQGEVIRYSSKVMGSRSKVLKILKQKERSKCLAMNH